ncbi:MAG: DUF2220 family protein [Bacteroidales bacterium]|jgi:hypothetical protein|nr:DUF2220 family protein [Bacteroidales bacterium]
MITIQEIKKKANALYKEYLQSVVNNQAFFPKYIRSNKKLSEDFLLMKEELSELISGSTDRKSYGYTIHYEKINTRKHGAQNQPVAITFEKESDFLKFIGKEKEAVLFKEKLQTITYAFPQLFDWCVAYPLSVIENTEQWTDLLKVCNYFVKHPNPNLYIRELPIEVHTKFIEENKTVLQSLLNILIDGHISNKEEKIFEKRFGLKSKPIQIRIRILDNEIARQYFSGLTDISVTEEELKQLAIPCANIYITENEMNFLTLPSLNNTIAFWGKGFAINALKHIDWLSGKNIYYWGDMDVHGFQILSQLRSYFPQVRSIMMNMETYHTFENLSVNNHIPNPPVLTNLKEKEIELYNFLKENDKRLEQEKISHSYSVNNICSL